MAANADSSRPLMTTDAPSWPSRRADDRPMLGSADDPVTTATLPVNLFVVVSVAMRPPPGSRSRYWVAPGWNRRRAASAWRPDPGGQLVVADPRSRSRAAARLGVTRRVGELRSGGATFHWSGRRRASAVGGRPPDGTIAHSVRRARWTTARVRLSGPPGLPADSILDGSDRGRSAWSGDVDAREPAHHAHTTPGRSRSGRRDDHGPGLDHSSP